MTATSTSAVAFTPAWREGSDDAPVFYLVPAGVIERSLMEAELSGRFAAGRVYGFELLAAVRSGVETLLAGDADQGRLLELIDLEASGEQVDLTDDDRRELADVKRVLATGWPEYQMLLEQVERRRELAPLIAFRRFCTGIEAKGVTFAKGRDGLVSEATLREIDPLELRAAGNRAFSMAYVTEEDAGNSARPSSSVDGQATSSSDDTSTAGGSSTGAPGKKTPGSRSRRGSGRSSTSTS